VRQIPSDPQKMLEELVILKVMRDHVGEMSGMFAHVRNLGRAIVESKNPPEDQLLALLDHDDITVRQCAVVFLGEIKSKKAEAQLQSLLESGNPMNVNIRLVSFALEKIGTDMAIATVNAWRAEHNITAGMIKQDRITERLSYFDVDM